MMNNASSLYGGSGGGGNPAAAAAGNPMSGYGGGMESAGAYNPFPVRGSASSTNNDVQAQLGDPVAIALLKAQQAQRQGMS
jgi:hypothetical protein